MSQDNRKGWNDHGADPRKSRNKGSAGVGGQAGSNKKFAKRKGFNDHGSDPRSSRHKGSAGVGGNVGSGKKFNKRKGWDEKPRLEDGGIVQDQAKYSAVQNLRNAMAKIDGDNFTNAYANGGVVANQESSSRIEDKLDQVQEALGSKKNEEENIDDLSREELLERLRNRA